MRKTGLSPNEYPASTVLNMVFGIEFNALVLQFHAFEFSAVLTSCLFFRSAFFSFSEILGSALMRGVDERVFGFVYSSMAG